MQPETVYMYMVGICRSLVSWYLKLLVAVIVIDLLVSLFHNSRLRYYACYFCYIMTASTISVIYMPFLLLRFHDPANILFASQPAVMLARLLGIKWELRGGKYLAKDQAAVVTATHQSIFDVMGLLVIGPTLQKAWAVARKEVFYYWPFGLTLWLSGVIFIDRKNGRKSNTKLMESIARVKKNNMKIVMFPEGTRNRKGETLLPFKKGAFRMAIEAQIPIIPMVYSPYYFINSDKKTFNKGKMIISTLPPISTKGKTMADLDMLLEKTQAIMEEEFQKLKTEIDLRYGPFKT
uniref:1-acyl-sn-glycerol-3-phosphate acyltransferase n=1 Tax=Graphocephala atropunctata TaxID=36148 RepID=A0A1B6LP14_9HEMI